MASSLPLPPLDTTLAIEACTGRAISLPKNHTVRIINTHGTQVVDFWAFTLSSAKLTSFLSLPHTRAATLHLFPQVGDVLTTNQRLPILEMVKDTSPGIHDTLIAACDPQRYLQLGVPVSENHASCAMNLRCALQSNLSIPWPTEHPLLEHWTPAPLNLFMNIPVTAAVSKGDSPNLAFEAPVSRAGDFVEMKAVVDDVVVVMSCCPQDLVPVNGVGMMPVGVEFVVGKEE